MSYQPPKEPDRLPIVYPSYRAAYLARLEAERPAPPPKEEKK